MLTSDERVQLGYLVECFDQAWKTVDNGVDAFPHSLHSVALIYCLRWRHGTLGGGDVCLKLTGCNACDPTLTIRAMISSVVRRTCFVQESD